MFGFGIAKMILWWLFKNKVQMFIFHTVKKLITRFRKKKEL